MKKILSTLAITVAAIATSYGQFSVTFTSTPGQGIGNNLAPFTLDGAPITSVADGYIVTFWWAADLGEDEMGSPVALGATFFNDANSNGTMAGYAGGFSMQTAFAIPHTVANQTGYLGIRIFQLDLADVLGLDRALTALDWQGYFANNGSGQRASSLTDTVKQDLIGGWWEDAQTGSEYIYEDYTMYTTLAEGVIVPTGTNAMTYLFGWSGTNAPELVPEPSTWLLLGAGAAFTVIMRRRKK